MAIQQGNTQFEPSIRSMLAEMKHNRYAENDDLITKPHEQSIVAELQTQSSNNKHSLGLSCSKTGWSGGGLTDHLHVARSFCSKNDMCVLKGADKIHHKAS
jgi:hypothetical protein